MLSSDDIGESRKPVIQCDETEALHSGSLIEIETTGLTHLFFCEYNGTMMIIQTALSFLDV